MLRVMLLQHLYGLSDPQAEEQLGDRAKAASATTVTRPRSAPIVTTNWFAGPKSPPANVDDSLVFAELIDGCATRGLVKNQLELTLKAVT